MASRHVKFARLIGYLNPEAWDWIVPHQLHVNFALGPHPEPWIVAKPGRLGRGVQVALNPQPLPPKALYALALADATVAEVISASRTGAILGGEAGANLQKRALSMVSDFEEICPRWPRWPKHWPPPPPPPWHDEQMDPSHLFFAGSRFLLATDTVENDRVQNALAAAGDKLIDMALEITT